jgi:hypothetical protein
MVPDIKAVLRDFVASPWFVLGSCVLSLAIGIIGTWLTIRYGMLRQMRYRCRSFCLIFGFVNKLPGLDVRYQGFGSSVENVTVSKVVLWNAGRGTIQKGDIVAKDNIRILIDHRYEILAADVVQQKNTKNGFDRTLSQDRKSATIRFEFINPSEGAVIQVVHTGTNSGDLSIEGTIKDAGSIRRTYGGRGDKGAHISPFIIVYTCLVMGSLLTIFAFYALYFQPDPEIMRLPKLVRLGLAVAVVSVLVGAMIVLNQIGRLPKGFDKYDEDF